MNHIDLLKDRHLDQLIMCSVYVMGKVILIHCGYDKIEISLNNKSLIIKRAIKYLHNSLALKNLNVNNKLS